MPKRTQIKISRRQKLKVEKPSTSPGKVKTKPKRGAQKQRSSLSIHEVKDQMAVESIDASTTQEPLFLSTLTPTGSDDEDQQSSQQAVTEDQVHMDEQEADNDNDQMQSSILEENNSPREIDGDNNSSNEIPMSSAAAITTRRPKAEDHFENDHENDNDNAVSNDDDEDYEENVEESENEIGSDEERIQAAQRYHEKHKRRRELASGYAVEQPAWLGLTPNARPEKYQRDAGYHTTPYFRRLSQPGIKTEEEMKAYRRYLKEMEAGLDKYWQSKIQLLEEKYAPILNRKRKHNSSTDSAEETRRFGLSPINNAEVDESNEEQTDFHPHRATQRRRSVNLPSNDDEVDYRTSATTTDMPRLQQRRSSLPRQNLLNEFNEVDDDNGYITSPIARDAYQQAWKTSPPLQERSDERLVERDIMNIMKAIKLPPFHKPTHDHPSLTPWLEDIEGRLAQFETTVPRKHWYRFIPFTLPSDASFASDRTFIDRMVVQQCLGWDGLCKAITDEYDLDEYKDILKQKFQSIRQGSESVLDFNHHYSKLMEDLGLSTETNDYVTHYLNGLNHTVSQAYKEQMSNARATASLAGLVPDVVEPPLKNVMKTCRILANKLTTTRDKGRHTPSTSSSVSSSTAYPKKTNLYCRKHGQGNHDTKSCHSLQSGSSGQPFDRHSTQQKLPFKPKTVGYQQQSVSMTAAPRTCYNCGQPGHLSPQCKAPRRQGPQVNNTNTAPFKQNITVATARKAKANKRQPRQADIRRAINTAKAAEQAANAAALAATDQL